MTATNTKTFMNRIFWLSGLLGAVALTGCHGIRPGAEQGSATTREDTNSVTLHGIETNALGAASQGVTNATLAATGRGDTNSLALAKVLGDTNLALTLRALGATNSVLRTPTLSATNLVLTAASLDQTDSVTAYP